MLCLPGDSIVFFHHPKLGAGNRYFIIFCHGLFVQVHISAEIKNSVRGGLNKGGQMNLRHVIRKIENLAIERKKRAQRTLILKKMGSWQPLPAKAYPAL